MQERKNKNQNNTSGSCPHAKDCGGCRYTGIPYKRELELKQKYMEKLLGEFGEVLPIIPMKKPRHYRMKVHHVFGYVKGKIISGSYKEGTHFIINTPDCLLEDETALAIIGTVKELAVSFKYKIYDEDRRTGFLRHIMIRKSRATGDVMLTLVVTSPIMPGKKNFISAITSVHPEIKTIVLNINTSKTSMVLGNDNVVIYGPGYISDEILGVKFRISPNSFYQVNPVQTEILYKTAIDFASSAMPSDAKELRVLDAYCGTGTIGLCFSKSTSATLTGVELNPNAVRDAISNARANNIDNAEFLAADATEYMNRLDKKHSPFDIIFMDPPRSGSTPDFIRACAKLSPKAIVYVSCGPETLARDLKLFKSLGFSVNKIQPVDMFPLTGHVECVVLMSRRNT